MVKLRLFTHELSGEDGEGSKTVAHQELEVEVPEAVASGLVALFFNNPEGTTSVHEETLASFPVDVPPVDVPPVAGELKAAIEGALDLAGAERRGEPTRGLSLVITKLEEALMWHLSDASDRP